MLKEFKPTILFLSKFLALYLTLNLMYGLFIDHYAPAPDPVTRWVSEQSTGLLQLFGSDVSFSDDQTKPAIGILNGERVVLSVFEGCNGINVVIIFLSFLLAYGRPSRKLLWFIPLGLLLIHLTNLGRISLLYGVTIHLPGFMYFAHKYLFTAIIYIVVFALWYLWLNKMYADTRD